MPSARLELSARDVDLAAVSREWPKSRINLDAEVGARRAPASGGFPLEGDAALHLLPSSVAGFELPKGEGSLEVSPAQLEVHVRMQEPGVPIDVDVRVDAHAALEVSANATAPSLEAVRRLRALGMNVSGAGTLRASGALYEGELTSRVALDTHHLGVGKVAVDTAHLEASLNGPLRDVNGLALRLAGHVRDVRAGALVAHDVLLAVHGTPKDLEVTVGERGGSFDVIALAAHVAPGPYTVVTRFSGRIEKAGIRLS